MSLRASTILAVLGTGALTLAPSAVHAQSQQTDSAVLPYAAAVPAEVPSSSTPSVDNGSVQTMAEVGTRVVVGGPFTSIAGQARSGVAALDAQTQALSSDFAPKITGGVRAVLPGPTADTVYVAGALTAVNGTSVSKIALVRTVDGGLVTSFRAPQINGRIDDIRKAGGRLYLAGTFTSVAGQPRKGLASLNASTGAFDPFMYVPLAEHHNNSGAGAQGPVGASAIDVTADGKTMIVIGNFRTAAGLPRVSAAKLDLAGTTATVSGWRTRKFEALCTSAKFDSYMRKVAFSPAGDYFAVTASGGYHANTLCDTASRWPTSVNTDYATPTWSVNSGGDTLWGVAITSSAVYVGGHQRWLNNPLGNNVPAPGAVPRPGIAALDPISGRPLSWNPGRHPRGEATYTFLPTSKGVWAGYDTPYIGNRQYLRPRVAFFPYTGTQAASTSVQSLPATVYTPSAGALTARAYDGTSAGSVRTVSSSIDWSTINGAFTVGGWLYLSSTDGTFSRASFSGGAIGTPTPVQPYHTSDWSAVLTGSGSTTYDGAEPPFYNDLATMVDMTYANGRIYWRTTGSSALKSAWFSPDSGIVAPTVTTVTNGSLLGDARGMFATGGRLYFLDAKKNRLSSVGLSGSTVSGPVVTGDTAGTSWGSRPLFLGTP